MFITSWVFKCSSYVLLHVNIKHFHQFYHLLIVLTFRRGLYSTFFVFENVILLRFKAPNALRRPRIYSICLRMEIVAGEDEREWISAKLDPLGSQTALIYR